MTRAISKVMAGLVRLYQLTLSHAFPNTCRYYPSCSEYTRQALLIHGPIKGLGLGAWRILRCNPWSKGGYDPVKGACCESHCEELEATKQSPNLRSKVKFGDCHAPVGRSQ